MSEGCCGSGGRWTLRGGIYTWTLKSDPLSAAGSGRRGAPPSAENRPGDSALAVRGRMLSGADPGPGSEVSARLRLSRAGLALGLERRMEENL